MTSQPHPDGKTAFEKVGVRVMSIWWSLRRSVIGRIRSWGGVLERTEKKGPFGIGLGVARRAVVRGPRKSVGRKERSASALRSVTVASSRILFCSAAFGVFVFRIMASTKRIMFPNGSRLIYRRVRRSWQDDVPPARRSPRAPRASAPKDS